MNDITELQFTTKTVEALIQQHGHCYLDTYVARAFAEATDTSQEDALMVLREQEAKLLRREVGRGKYERARERACMLLATGYEQGLERRTTFSASRLICSFEMATAYGIAVRLEGWREGKA